MIKYEILPEICYKYKPLSLEDVFNAYVDKKTVTGRVEKILQDKQIVVVRLGDDILCHMPYSESTIYPLHYSKNINSTVPTNIFTLIGKNIQVKITGIGGPFVKVSRKANMLIALQELCRCELASLHITRLDPKCAFGDIGDGIISRIIIDEVCKTHIKTVREYLQKNDVVTVKILHRTPDNYIDASYKQAFKPYAKADYTVGDIVKGKICDFVHGSKKPGFYVHIAPQVSGIMDVKTGEKNFKYGTMVECHISGISDHGLHLKFSKLL